MILEADVAFDQNGAPVIAAERPGPNLWIYFFDPSLGKSVFRKYGPGRSPRIMLDDPDRPQQSEILCFYIAGGELKYRKQSDRFTTEQSTGVAMSADQYVERVVRSTDRRIHVVYSTRDQGTGQYSLSWLSSEVYPWELAQEELDVTATALQAELRELIVDAVQDPAELDVAAAAQAGALSTALYQEDDGKEVDLGAQVQSVDITEIIVVAAQEAEGMDVAGQAQAGALSLAVIEYDASVEELDVAASAQAGLLEAV